MITTLQTLTMSTPAFFVRCLVGVILLLGMGALWKLSQLRRLAASRRRAEGTGRTAFLEYLEGRGLSAEQSQAIYQYFQNCILGIKAFPVELDDELGRTVGICGSDVDSAAQDIAALCRRNVPSEVACTQDQTVRDLLDIVVAAPTTDRPSLG
ncbi:MAG: hypothetical protein LAP87_31475 [Acidobacteriia bacterium]|nr:hypothetical protein [Terriglobia bacterium]